MRAATDIISVETAAEHLRLGPDFAAASPADAEQLQAYITAAVSWTARYTARRLLDNTLTVPVVPGLTARTMCVHVQDVRPGVDWTYRVIATSDAPAITKLTRPINDAMQLLPDRWLVTKPEVDESLGLAATSVVYRLQLGVPVGVSEVEEGLQHGILAVLQRLYDAVPIWREDASLIALLAPYRYVGPSPYVE